MAKKKATKAWNEMTFTELDHDALIEHALSLGGEKSVEAIAFLQKLESEKVTFNAEMKEVKRKALESKKKRKKDENGKLITLDKPLYTAEEIEEKLNKIEEVPKYSFIQLKREYCKKYYPDLIENAKSKDEPTFADKLAKALEKAKAQAK